MPQAASIWSADPEQMWTFPAAFLAEFFENHGTLQMVNRPQWRTVVGGSRNYVHALCAPFAESVHLETPVESVERLADGVRVRSARGTELFDEVVIATHSDQALRLLADPTPAEREILGAIPYRPNETVLHTDTALMPRRRAAWASWNFHLLDEPGPTTLTYDMNRLQRLDTDEQFLVTLNRTEAIDPSKVIEVIEYSHPVFTNEGMRAQERWRQISGVGRHALLRCLLALGLPRGRLLVRPAGLRGARRARPRARWRRPGDRRAAPRARPSAAASSAS